MSLWLKNLGRQFFVLSVIAVTTTTPSEGFAKDDPFLNKLLGTWTGKGELLGTDSRFKMTWKWVLDGKFARLTFQNKFLKAQAFYQTEGNDEYKGTWFDSRGQGLASEGRG
ncbi:hypothetical protein MJD09_06750 [bacterium]|nr:hypothetical protein [bacterium]